jgi:hypothetical protein
MYWDITLNTWKRCNTRVYTLLYFIQEKSEDTKEVIKSYSSAITIDDKHNNWRRHFYQYHTITNTRESFERLIDA